MIAPRDFDCAHVVDLLDDYRRNEIEPHLRVLISEHLAGCEACTNELRTREAVANAMQMALPGSAPPKHLPSSVRRAIASQQKPSSAGNKSARLLPWMLAAAVLVTIGIATLQVQTATPLQRPAEIAAVAEDSEMARKAMEMHGELQPSAAVAPTTNNELLPPPASAKYPAAPATMQPNTAQPGSPQGFSASDQGFAPEQAQTEPTMQEGFAPTMDLFQEKQKPGTPATTARTLMGSPSRAVQDQSTTGATASYFAARSSTMTATEQTSGSAVVSQPSPATTATLTTTTADAPTTTAPR